MATAQTSKCGSCLRRRNRCVLTSLLILALVVVGLAASAAYRAVFFPRVDQALGGEAMLVLGPVNAKLAPAVEMVRNGSIDVLLVSDQYLNDEGTGQCRPEIDALLEDLGAMDADFPADVLCFRPNPVTTQGEAMFLRDVGAEYEWTSVTVLAHSFHVERAPMLVERCWDRNLSMVAVNRPLGTREAISTYFYQSGALVKAAITPRCDSRLPAWMEGFGWKVSSTESRLDPGSESLNGN